MARNRKCPLSLQYPPGVQDLARPLYGYPTQRPNRDFATLCGRSAISLKEPGIGQACELSAPFRQLVRGVMALPTKVHHVGFGSPVQVKSRFLRFLDLDKS
jgi:hypothetical protein